MPSVGVVGEVVRSELVVREMYPKPMLFGGGMHHPMFLHRSCTKIACIGSMTEGLLIASMLRQAHLSISIVWILKAGAGDLFMPLSL